MVKTEKIEAVIALDKKNQNSFKREVNKLQKKFKRDKKSGTIAVPKDAYLKRGLIYLSHVPHGFFEYELRSYFKQFGVVTNVRLLRSHRTGASKGAAFIEFEEPEVAKIVAETMDNYLMFKRRLECKYIEPADRHSNLFRFSLTHNKFPMKKTRVQHIAAKHKKVTDEEHNKLVKKSVRRLKKKNMLEFCQVVNLNVAIDDIEVNPLKEEKVAKQTLKKEKEPKIKVELLLDLQKAKLGSPLAKKSKKGKKTKETSVKPEQAWSDESLVISPAVLSPRKSKTRTVKALKEDKMNKAAKEVKKSLKTIQKTKDKKKKASTDSIEKIVSNVTVAGRKGKAQLMLDPTLVTQVNFTEQKAKKNSALKTKKVKK